MSDLQASPAEPSLVAKIDSEKGHPLASKTVAKRAAMGRESGQAR